MAMLYLMLQGDFCILSINSLELLFKVIIQQAVFTTSIYKLPTRSCEHLSSTINNMSFARHWCVSYVFQWHWITSGVNTPPQGINHNIWLKNSMVHIRRRVTNRSIVIQHCGVCILISLLTERSPVQCARFILEYCSQVYLTRIILSVYITS